MNLIQECDIDSMLEARVVFEDELRHYILECDDEMVAWGVVGWLPTANSELAKTEFRKKLPKIAKDGRRYQLWKGWITSHPSQDEQII